MRHGIIFLWAAVAVQAQTIGPGDVYLEAREEGFYLFIKQVPGMGSVMLTESMERPDRAVATFALRALETNPVNGSERRLLNERFLPAGHLSLIDSTPEHNARFKAPAFVILMPPRVQFGYPGIDGSRHGIHDLRQLIREGGPPYWFSIRGFQKPYGDYTGNWRDNPFEIKAIHASQDATPLPERPGTTLSEDRFHPNLRDRFSTLSRQTHSTEGGGDLVRIIGDILRNYDGESLDLVICLDTTRSMRPHLQTIKDRLLAPIRDVASRFTTFRVGWVLYRDYMEEYLTRTLPFRSDWDLLQRDLQAVQVGGGGDVPEAVIEALYTAVQDFPWSARKRLIILVGDAPPHEIPRGRITQESLKRHQREKNIEIHSIVLPFR